MDAKQSALDEKPADCPLEILQRPLEAACQFFVGNIEPTRVLASPQTVRR